MHVEADDVGHRYPGQPDLFAHVSFRADPESVTALCGPSGSGKSTLLNILAGWMRPAAGRIVRVDIARTRWVFQNPHGVPLRSAVDHIALPLLARGLGRAEAEPVARRLLHDFHLDGVAARSFAELSGGEAQRLMLARAVASQPDLLLIDEPTAQLDRASASTVAAAMENLGRAGIIVVVATHDPMLRDRCTQIIELGEQGGRGDR